MSKKTLYVLITSLILITLSIAVLFAAKNSDSITVSIALASLTCMIIGIIILALTLYRISLLQTAGLEICTKQQQKEILRAYNHKYLPSTVDLHPITKNYAKIQIRLLSQYAVPYVLQVFGIVLLYLGINIVVKVNETVEIVGMKPTHSASIDTGVNLVVSMHFSH